MTFLGIQEELYRIDDWERKGLKFTRRDGHLLKDGNGAYHIRARIMTAVRGCGMAVGYAMFDPSRGNERNEKPWMVQYGKDVLWFTENEVSNASFLEYCFRTKGAFGGTSWVFVGLLLAACVRLTMISPWLGAAEILAFLAFTYCNYKFWFR
jgi:hypothetical protein